MNHQGFDWGLRGGVGGVASTTKRTPPEAREPSQGCFRDASCVQLGSAALCRRHTTARSRVEVDLTGGTMLRRTKCASRLASTREERRDTCHRATDIVKRRGVREVNWSKDTLVQIDETGKTPVQTTVKRTKKGSCWAPGPAGT